MNGGQLSLVQAGERGRLGPLWCVHAGGLTACRQAFRGVLRADGLERIDLDLAALDLRSQRLDFAACLAAASSNLGSQLAQFRGEKLRQLVAVGELTLLSKFF